MTEANESPDKDKALELTDDKPPKMGEGEELVEGKEGKETTPPITGEGEEAKLDPEILEIMKKKGFKDVSEVAKAYEASERERTKLESERRIQSFIPREVPARPKVEREFTPFPTLTKEPFDMSKEEFETYQAQREKAHDERLKAMYEDAEADKEWKREYNETMKIVNKDPERFEEIKPQLSILHRQYPDAPLSEIYPMADKMEKEQAKERADKFRSDVFGGNVDPDKLKVLLSKLKPATISDAGGTGADKVGKTGRQEAEDKIWGGIKSSDMRRE